MGLTITFIIILSICIGLDLDILFDGISEGDPGKTGLGLGSLLLCVAALTVNTHNLVQELYYPKVEVISLPQMDTLTQIKNRDTTRTYVLDFTKLEQPAKHIH